MLFDIGPPRVSPEPLVSPIQTPVWTKNKSALIARYLRYFVFITKHGTYIDCFAGPQYASQLGMWSARLVLENEPKWLRHFHLFELDSKQLAHLDRLCLEHSRPSSHSMTVHRGDCNDLVPAFLDESPIKAKEATFCLLDQRTFECKWSTVQALARYKPNGEHKIELFYFLPNWWLPRAIAGMTKNQQIISAWWGRDDWDALRNTSHDARCQLFVNRFKGELGYASVKPWPIMDRRGGRRIMYFMLHATDHPEAPKLMQRAYRKAVEPPESFEQLSLELSVLGE